MYDTSTNFLNVHEWAYGVTEIVHIVSLAAAIGFIAVVDLRLLGLRIGAATPQRLMRATGIVSLVGLVLAITTGFMIFSTDPIRYFNHPAMRFKLVVLVAAVAYHYSLHGRIVRGDYSVIVRRAVAIVSLLLWTMIVFSGIFYSFT